MGELANTHLKNFSYDQMINIIENLLIDDKEKIYRCCGSCFSKGFTHLHKCVMNTNECPFLNTYIDTYLNLYPDEINVRNEKGYTALMLASPNTNTCSTYETVEILLKHGANVNEKCSVGCTALVLSSTNLKNSDENTLKILLKYGADVNLANKYNGTALMYVIINVGNYENINETIKVLLDYGAKINLQDNCDSTALMYAIWLSFSKSEEIIKTLLDYGSNIDLKNIYNDTSISLAFKNGKFINILLPNRKLFIEKTIINKEKILSDNSKFWKVSACDFKIICKTMKNFREIIECM